MVTVSYPIAPTVEKRNGTLLDTAVVEDGIQYLATGSDNIAEGMFESYAAMSFGSVAAWCASNAKTFGQTPGWTDGFRMAAYGGVKCNAVGGGVDVGKVRQVFELGESAAVETGLMALRLTDGVANGFTATEDITPAGGAVKPTVAAALLDAWMSRNYVGRILLHAPVVIADLMLDGNTVELQGDILVTKTGVKVVSGVGYDFPNLAPDGSENTDPATRWMYASGGIVVRRGEAFVKDAFNQSNNEVTALAERGYVVIADGPVAAIEVQVSA